MKKVLLALVISTALAGMAFVGFMAWLVLHGHGPGSFHRSRLEAVVAEVRRLPFPPDTEADFYLDDMSNPRSLRPWDGHPMESGKQVGRVWAERTADGHLKVVIETTDSGHAGEYGFAYSDLPLGPVSSAAYPEVRVPGRLNLVEGPESQIDEHWWRVLTNLN